MTLASINADGDFRVGDVQELPYVDQVFDAVLAADVLPYVADPLAALHELRRVCARPGRVVVARGGRRSVHDRPLTWAALAPLALPDLPEAIGRRLVEEHLLDPQRFWLPMPPAKATALSTARSFMTMPTNWFSFALSASKEISCAAWIEPPSLPVSC